MPDPRISVIVCTKNRESSLARTLESLAADPSVTPAEIIVVDNASTDGTPGVIAAARHGAPATRPVVALTCPDPGHSRARNHAIPVARGEIVAFTDDDVTVHPGWIDELARAFAPGVDIVGGRVVPEVDGPRPAWLEFRQQFSITLWDYGPQPMEMGLLESPGPGKPRRQVYPIGANMAFRRSVLTEMGQPFDPRLGHTGIVSMGYDEWDLFDRLADGHRMVYAPDAVVTHHLDGSRLEFGRARRMSFQVGFGAARSANARAGALPSYPRRVYRVARGCWRVTEARRRNARGDLTADGAFAEFDAYWKLGREIETLLSATPKLSERAAARLV